MDGRKVLSTPFKARSVSMISHRLFFIPSLVRQDAKQRRIFTALLSLISMGLSTATFVFLFAAKFPTETRSVVTVVRPEICA